MPASKAQTQNEPRHKMSQQAKHIREQIKNKYPNRFFAAAAGIWGNTAAEAMYPQFELDQLMQGNKEGTARSL